MESQSSSGVPQSSNRTSRHWSKFGGGGLMCCPATIILSSLLRLLARIEPAPPTTQNSHASEACRCIVYSVDKDIAKTVYSGDLPSFTSLACSPSAPWREVDRSSLQNFHKRAKDFLARVPPKSGAKKPPNSELLTPHPQHY